jgi:transcriptional regulator with XRE-family HTH domain
MYTHIRGRSAKLTKLRNQAGCWLRDLREKRGLSQRGLARKVGVAHHTFISQLENGRIRVPPDRYLVWAEALGVEPRAFVRALLAYYDPVTYEIIFAGESFTSFPPSPGIGPEGRSGHSLAPLTRIYRLRHRFSGEKIKTSPLQNRPRQ